MTQTLAVIGAKNLGKQIALHFAKKGWRVIVAARSHDTVDAVVKAVNEAGGQGISAVCDVTKPETLNALTSHGKVDLCVAAQGPGGRFGSKPLLEIDDAELDQSYNTFVKGAWNLMKVVGKSMTDAGNGTIIQIGTSSCLRTRDGFAVLGSIGFALRGMIQVAAREFRPKGVHVALLPADGPIYSEKTAGWASQLGGVGKMLDEEEIAKACEYLHEQDKRSWTHEMILRPSEGDWTAPY